MLTIELTPNVSLIPNPIGGRFDHRDIRGRWLRSFRGFGDASGGELRVITRLYKGFIYTVEQAFVCGENPTVGGKIEIVGDVPFDPFGNAAVRIITPALPDSSGGVNVTAPSARPLWGEHVAAVKIGGSIANAATQIIVFASWGYIWDLESLILPGGPRGPDAPILSAEEIVHPEDIGFNYGKFYKGTKTQRWWRDTRGWPFRKFPGQWGRL